MSATNEKRWGLLHIMTLFSLAVGQPLFEQMSGSPEFFIIRGSGTADLILLVLILTLAIPGVIALLVIGVSRWNQRIGWILFVLVLWTLFACLCLIPVNRAWNLPFMIELILCFTVAAILVAAYNRYRSIRTFVSFLSPALVLVPAIFLMNDSISKLILKKEVSFPHLKIDSSTHIMLLVFDEFPLTSLLKDPFTIDADLYPNFADLAATTTWYRNATTVSDFTNYAVPAILTGRFPRALDLPIVYDHASNLFTALGQSYDLVVFEDGERLMPVESYRLKDDRIGLAGRLRSVGSDLMFLYLHMVLPRALRDRLLPPVDQAWGNFENNNGGGADHHPTTDRVVKFQNFVDSIESKNRPTLFYLHSMLPHAPWDFLPSGASQSCGVTGDIRGYHKYLECHLLTVKFADRLVGQVIQRLKQTGMYENCLIIITADHGACFRAGPARRAVRTNNYRDVMLVPLFIKFPHQLKGETSDLNVWTIDVLPTIAEVLNVRFPWVEGSSVLGPSIQSRTSKQFFSGARHEMMKFEPVMRADSQTLSIQQTIIQGQSFQASLRQ